MTIGDMVVNLGVNSSPLSSGLSSARSQIGSFGDFTVKKMASVGGAVAVALTGFAGVSAFKEMTAGALESIDTTAKLADSLGTTTETMVGLQHASDLSGNSQEDLAKGMQKLQRGLGQIESGGKGPAKAFERLGLKFEDIKNIDTGAAFLEIADKISQLESPALQTSTAMEIFGKAGVNLLPLLREGKGGLEGLISETDALGTSFSRVDAAKVEAANDAMTRAQGAIKGVATQTAIGIAPFIESLATGFTSLAPMIGQTFAFISESVLTAIDTAAWAIANWELVAETAFVGAELGLVAFAGQVVHFFGGVLPGLFSWFYDNWSNIWRTALDYSLTVLINLGENIRSIFAEIWDFIASGGTNSMELSWKPLTDGFHNSISKLPEIAGREIGPLEKELTARFGQLGSEAGQSLQDHLTEQSAMRNAAPALDPGASGPGLTPDPNAGKEKKAKAGGNGGPEDLQVGSAGALSAIVKAAGSQASAREAHAAKMAAQTLSEQQKQTGYLATIAGEAEDTGQPEEYNY